MLMNFDRYMNEYGMNFEDYDTLVAYPSIFELICLLPLSQKPSVYKVPSYAYYDSIS